MSDPNMVACRFHIRRPSPTPGKYVFESADYGSPTIGAAHLTPHPPMVGDTLAVTGEQGRLVIVRVVARDWDYPQYGSFNWPAGTPSPKRGPSLTVVVEECDGLFRDQYIDPTEDEEDTTDGG